MKTLPIITVLGVVSSLVSAFYLGQIDELSFDRVTIQFCPQTANINQPNARESQGKLDLQYCRYRHRLLKEVWESEQYKAAIPLSKESFSIQEYKGDNSGGIWLLLAPFLAGSAYLAWSNKCQIDYDKKFKLLEDLKSSYKLATVSARNEREFKATAINQRWDTQRVKAGQISIDAMQDRLRRQSEIQDRTHDSTLKQFDLNDSQADKQIAENQLAVTEANKKRDKLSKTNHNEDNTNQKPTNELLKDSLIDALKNHEDGWLWNIIKAAKPLWIIGEQGTGKTNTSVSIGLIRKYCLGISIFRIADRHLNGANSKVWKLLEAQNKADNDSAIIEVLQDTYERRLERIALDLDDKQAEQFLLDEFTHLRDIDEETITKFIKSTFSDTRKAKERFIGVTHLGTNAAFGDGTAAMRKAGSILIEKFTADGEKPLSRVVIKHGLVDSQGNKLEDVEHTLPTWFEALTIYNHFHNKPIEFN
ncbi:hypothetical protein NIES22_72650 (plasmid) [Calothrix brevissima NIES-22]|nr:hypothetical protein NIES22_72650 [Calothrix brevissima NIES-22]